MRERSITRLAAAMAVCAGLCTGTAAWAVDFPETEPNDTKAAANIIAAMAPGDTLSGVTTGTSTTVAGNGSADYFDITTTAAPTPGIYRYRLAITTAGTAGHTGTIRGLTVTAGVPNAGTDATIQTSVTTSTPARMVQWYANEAASRLVFRVTGTASTTAAYSVTLTRDAVTPSVVPSSIDAGPFFFTTIGQTTVDTEVVLYDTNFNPISGAANDDESVANGGTGGTLQTRLQRSLAAGTYIAVVAPTNLCNNQGAPADDDFQTGAVMDYPNALCTSSSTTNSDNDFIVGNRCTGASQSITNVRAAAFDVTLWQFTLTGPTLPDPVAFTAGSATPASAPAGSSTLLSVTASGGTPTAVTGDLTAFGLTASEAFADPELDNIWTYTLNVPLAQAPGNYNVVVTGTGGSCSPATRTIAVNVPSPGDSCSSAFAITPGVPVIGNNAAATNESPAPPTCTGFSVFNLGIWYTFTPSNSNRYIASTCNAGTAFNTRVYVYSGSCGALTCVGANALASPACGVRADAATVNFCANSGTTYYILVTNDTTGSGNFELSLTDTGTDCSPPANDNCGGALAISVGGTVTGDSTNATNESPAPPTCSALSTFNLGMWYTFTEGATARRLSASTCSASTTYNTRVYVYSGSCGSFACVGANALASPACAARSDAAEVVFCTTPNTTYYFLVTNDTTGTGQFGLSLTDTGIGCAPPANDDCANATVVSSTPFGSTVAADTATDDLDTSCNATANVGTRRGVWYVFTPSEPGNLSFVENGAADVIFAVFTGSCAGLSEVYCNTNETGTVNFAASAGTTYYILAGLASDTAAPPATYQIVLNYAISSGACCNGTSCTITAGQVACTTGGGTFQGYGTNCGGGPLAENNNPTDVPMPDFTTAGGVTTVSSAVNVTDASVITDLDVYVTINHPFVGDVYLRLQGPNGTIIDLIRRPNVVAPCAPDAIGDGDDLLGTYIFDDDAASSLHAATIDGDVTNPLPGGRYRSTGCTGTLTSLDAASPAGFGGISAAGTWTLLASDEDGAIVGTVENFGLVINGVEAGTPCNQTGACCQGTTCVAAASAACTGANTSYSGDGTVCNVFGVNNTTPCCFANFNQTGGVTVQDIFDFLGAYFSANTQADINGGGTSVQDIFDFLSAYFTGCV